ncbi:hypothetical protein [uncultured Adlercreutzia sp.]|uniref:hypothetical protein n=1 Tax=uncultured Adlercreutzia sp. TaxID=875803 RepID=UPI0025F3AC90|nr:hypothetical protein [uncultured Adlercreutzia sp.]MCI9262326.1 hypothetical protein [Eggerthellaceae bacterium]
MSETAAIPGAPSEAAIAPAAAPTASAIQAALLREPAKRELYLAALTFTSKQPEPAGRFAIEEAIDAQPQRSAFFQPAGALVDALVSFGALDEQLPEAEFDEDTEETFVDMARATYTLTEAGAEALEALSPALRLDALLEREAGRKEGFLTLMDFCAGKARTRREIDELLNAACAAEKNERHVAGMALYPSYYVDCLEKAGALTWQNGWTTTEEARAYLAVFQ